MPALLTIVAGVMFLLGYLTRGGVDRVKSEQAKNRGW